MSFLRTMSTQRLLALIAGIVLAIVGGTAIALAATGGGPVPQPKPLDRAVHDAVAGPEPGGLTARVQLTNHLLGSAGIEGTTPLLNGASGRLWLTQDHLRLELQSDQGDSQVVVDKDSFWVYDVSSNTVYRGRLDAHAEVGRQRTPSLTDVRDAIAEVGHHAALSGARPTDVAGQPAYDVRIVPKDGGLVGAVRLAWDANRGVPLRVAAYAKGSRSPVAELKATKVSYGPVPASTFAVAPPKGATVVDLSARTDHSSNASEPKRALPFKVVAPSALAGQRRTEIHRVGDDGALATYGHGFGGIAVLERVARPSRSEGPRLPRVHLGGVAAEEVVTPLGTLIRLEHGGVSYTVVGSITKATAQAAVRGLVQ